MPLYQATYQIKSGKRTITKTVKVRAMGENNALQVLKQNVKGGVKVIFLKEI